MPIGKRQDPMVVPLSAQQLELMATNNFSSTERKITCIRNTVEVWWQQAPELI